MRIMYRHLRRIIREEINQLSEGTLYFTRNRFGGVSVEDEDGEYIGTGEMVRSLLDAGIQDFTSEKGLATMLKSDAEGIQGGLEHWDSDVFPEYYDVDIDTLVQLYAKQKGMQVEEVEELEADW